MPAAAGLASVSVSNLQHSHQPISSSSPHTPSAADSLHTALPPHATLPPQVHVNGRPASAPKTPKLPAASPPSETDASGWGANFWVTLADPSTGISFYACPATGEVSWDPPVGNFLLPPSPDGEWWEMIDESSGLPYYYHTKTGQTVWERPQAFVIPLAVLQNTTLTRRLSLTNRVSVVGPQTTKESGNSNPAYRRSRSYIDDRDNSRTSTSSSLHPEPSPRRRSQSSTRSNPSRIPTAAPHISPGKQSKQTLRRSASSEKYGMHASPLAYERGHPLAPIPGSPYATDASPPGSPSSKRSASRASHNSKHDKEKERDMSSSNVTPTKEPTKRKSTSKEDGVARSRSMKSTKSNLEYMPYRAPQPQSLTAALEMIAMTSSPVSAVSRGEKEKDKQKDWSNNKRLAGASDDRPPRVSASLGRTSGQAFARPRISIDPNSTGGRLGGTATVPSSPTRDTNKENKSQAKSPTSPPASGKPEGRLIGRDISAPVFDPEATLNMSPVKMRNAGKPILIPHGTGQNGRPSMSELKDGGLADPDLAMYFPKRRTSTLHTGTYPVLPDDLASDIQQFSESQYARLYFSIHRTGFIFRRKVPVEQMMTWQKTPLNAPLLLMNKPLNKEAIRSFKSIQRVMGDRDRDRPVPTGSMTSLVASGVLLEEERGLLAEGLSHGELRDEIYCQVMKQLTGNPSTESVFKGWQLLCVLLVTFPPSKNFEPSLRSFMNQATHQSEGRVDVMAKYCLRRLAYISRKGPRGKPPTLPEIEAASDAAFHPSIFGESLDGIFRLQERNYPHQKVPIILPFLSDGILALGGTKSEGIFRVPGDGDLVSELKLRIDKGYYTLDGFDDPHVLASLLKLWLRELADPLVPNEMYNECIAQSNDPEACVTIVHRLPTINRRVVLFVISFLQLFLEEKTQIITKMTAPNLALVMAPNLLRCGSESMAVVFTNAQYEQAFVHNLLMHLRCDVVDPDFVPTHGRGAIPSPAPPIPLRKSRSHRARHRADS